jgi:hypothetical protein
MCYVMPHTTASPDNVHYRTDKIQRAILVARNDPDQMSGQAITQLRGRRPTRRITFVSFASCPRPLLSASLLSHQERSWALCDPDFGS